MSKEKIEIGDFSLFFEMMKSVGKMSDGVKLSINDCGLTIYAKNGFSKCEITSNVLKSENFVEFNIGKVGMFLKILSTVMELYKGNDMNMVKMFFDKPFIRIESSKFKTKLNTVSDKEIINFIGSKVHTELTDQVVFTTSSSLIREINAHSFISEDRNSVRVYLSVDKDMQNNTITATIGNDNNELDNSISLEFGLINSGSLGDKRLITDFNGINILNMVPSDEIKVSLANERNVLISRVRKNGNNDTFFDINIYIAMMVK